MSDKFTLGVGQAHELEYAFGRCDWTPADVKALATGDMAARLLPIIRGLAKIVPITNVNVINSDADPFVPKGYTVVKHQKNGQIFWDTAGVTLYLSERQRLTGRFNYGMLGVRLQEELADKQVLNANVLDWLLRNPNQVPKEWTVSEKGKKRVIYFWGTIYKDATSKAYVRCMYFSNRSVECFTSIDYINGDFRSNDFAAILSS